MKQFKVVLIGAGGRGVAYAENIKLHPDKFELVGVADPIKKRCKDIQRKFNLADEACYDSWEEMLSQPKIADIAIIATQDNGHYEPAMKAIELGYNLLLEKPLAQTAKECIDIAKAAEKKGVDEVLVMVPVNKQFCSVNVVSSFTYPNKPPTLSVGVSPALTTQYPPSALLISV